MQFSSLLPVYILCEWCSKCFIVFYLYGNVITAFTPEWAISGTLCYVSGPVCQDKNDSLIFVCVCVCLHNIASFFCFRSRLHLACSSKSTLFAHYCSDRHTLGHTFPPCVTMSMPQGHSCWSLSLPLLWFCTEDIYIFWVSVTWFYQFGACKPAWRSSQHPEQLLEAGRTS